MEKHVYFVRHGESEENAGHIHRGPEAALTEKGQDQAKLVAERIERIGINALIASPFTRARDTAQAIAERLDIEVQEDKLLGEWLPPSETIGMHRDQPERKGIFEKILGTLEDPHFRHSDEETFADLVSRADAALAALLEHPAQRMCVVTHGGFLRILIGRIIFGEDFSKKHFVSLLRNVMTTNTGVTYITYTEERPRWHLITWNDLSHLG